MEKKNDAKKYLDYFLGNLIKRADFSVFSHTFFFLSFRFLKMNLEEFFWGLFKGDISFGLSGKGESANKRLSDAFGEEAAQKIKSVHKSYVEGLEKVVFEEVKTGEYGDEALKKLRVWLPKLFE